MISFKQFLLEGVVSQINSTRRRSDLLAQEMAKGLSNDSYKFGGIRTMLAVDPADNVSSGSYRYIPAGAGKSSITGQATTEPIHYITVNTDKPAKLFDPQSAEKSTLRHELQHLFQRDAQLSANPEYAMNRKISSKFNDIRGMGPNSTEHIKQNNMGQDYSYILDPQEVNARGVQAAGDAIEQHGRLSTSKLLMNPEIDDFALNFEKSGGKLTPPKLNSNIARTQADRAFDTHMGIENKILDSRQRETFAIRKSDATQINKDIVKARKSVQSDIARGLQANIPTAQAEVENLYGTKTTSPQRERATRVANTQAEVETGRAKFGGFQTTPFLSDPLSTANMAADMAGALGDVNSKAQLTTKAAASLNNPNFSDSEQMMGDAFLRGGGEEFQVDPRSLQVQKQREKDRLRDKDFKYNSFERR
jgi:hypothetical protein